MPGNRGQPISGYFVAYAAYVASDDSNLFGGAPGAFVMTVAEYDVVPSRGYFIFDDPSKDIVGFEVKNIAPPDSLNPEFLLIVDSTKRIGERKKLSEKFTVISRQMWLDRYHLEFLHPMKLAGLVISERIPGVSPRWRPYEREDGPLFYQDRKPGLV